MAGLSKDCRSTSVNRRRFLGDALTGGNKLGARAHQPAENDGWCGWAPHLFRRAVGAWLGWPRTLFDDRRLFMAELLLVDKAIPRPARTRLGKYARKNGPSRARRLLGRRRLSVACLFRRILGPPVPLRRRTAGGRERNREPGWRFRPLDAVARIRFRHRRCGVGETRRTFRLY